MSNPIRRKETTMLPSSMLDNSRSYHGKPVMQLETTLESQKSNLNVDISDLMLPEELKTRMFSHQVEGLQWLYGLHYSHPGGILGDDMGLGKTFQVSCLLTGLMRSSKIQRALIIAPVSVLPSWNRELLQHLAPYVKRVGIEMCSSEMTKKKRQKVLSDVFASRNCKIVISSYNLVANMTDDFVGGGSWDYVILDEGHIIKNPTTKLSKAMHMLKSNHRLILTGTPIQNNLIEFWALVNWATSGNLLGTKAHFKAQFVDPILAGQEPKRKKCEHTETLKLKKKVELVVWIPLSTTQRIVYEKYLRKRTVQDAMERKNFAVDVINDLKTISRHPFLMEASEELKKANGKETGMARVRDDADFGSLEKALNSLSLDHNKRGERGANEGEEEEEVFNIGRAKDSRFNTAKPRGQPAYSAQSVQRGAHCRLDCEDEFDDADCSRAGRKIGANASVFEVAGRKPEVEELFQDSVKLRVMVKLTQRLKRAGHRLLVFSQSKKMLDIIQKVLSSYGMSSCRIDGSVTGRDRQMIIDDFNAGGECDEEGENASWDSSPKVGRRGKEGMGMGMGPSICLLTTKACGQGITLTGADRVIIFDPSWNPAEDRQAVDRAFRIGQKKDVVVYRLIMASSVEEKMYEKQVFKDGVRIVTESGSSSRYFSSAETKELFTLGPPDKSEVMERLWAMTGTQLRSFEDTGGDLPKVCGYTRHDTLYAEARPEDVQNRTGQKGGGGVRAPTSYKPNPPTHTTYNQESRSGDLDPHTGERRDANTMDKWIKRAAVPPHPREVRSGPDVGPGPSAQPTIDLSQESPPPSDCKRSHLEDTDDREDEYDFEDLKTGLKPAAVRSAPAADKSERAQFWASVGSDDSDADAESEEDGDVDVGLGCDPQLDLDRNGENGGCFESSSYFDEEEEEGPVRVSKSSMRVVRTSILMGRDYYSRPSEEEGQGQGQESGVCQSRCLTDEDYVDQLHRECETAAASNQMDEQSVSITKRPMTGTRDGDSDGMDRGSEHSDPNPNPDPVCDYSDVDAEGGTAEDMSDCGDVSSGCGAAPSRESSPTLEEGVKRSSVAPAKDRHTHLPEECDREGRENNHDGDSNKSCSDSDSDSVTVKAVRTQRDPGPSPILESVPPTNSRYVTHSPDAAWDITEDDGLVSERDALSGGSDRGKGCCAEGGSVCEADSRGCKGKKEEIKTSVTAVVEVKDFGKELEAEQIIEEEVEVEVEAEGVIEDEIEAVRWVAEDSPDSDWAEGFSEEALEGEGDEEGPLEAVFGVRTVAHVSCDSEYAAFSANGKGCEAEDDSALYKDSVSESCHMKEEGEEEELLDALRELEIDVQDKCGRYRGSRVVGSAGMDEREMASSAASELSRSERRCSSWTALSPGAIRGDQDLDLDTDCNLGAYVGSGGSWTPPLSSSAHQCPASTEAIPIASAIPIDRAVSYSCSEDECPPSPRNAFRAAGAAYHTPGRVVLHVETPHSTRGFCVALDSESDSDGEEEGSNSNVLCDSLPPGDDKGEGDRDTISPLGKSPLPMPRVKDAVGFEWSSPFSLPMSPMSASTVNSAVTSFSLSPHAIRSLALARLNLVTESNIKLCPSTMAPQTGKYFRGSRACDLVKIRLAGTAFEASPPREGERKSSLPSILEPRASASIDVDCPAGARGTEIVPRYDNGNRKEESALESSDEVSLADTVLLDWEGDRDTLSRSPNPARTPFQKGNQWRLGEDEDEDEDEWVPKSACRQRLVKLSDESESESEPSIREDEDEVSGGSISIVSVKGRPAAAFALPGALDGQHNRSRVINLEDSDDGDGDVVVVPTSRGGRENSAKARKRSVIIDSDSDKDEEKYSIARIGDRGYDHISDLKPAGRGRGGGAMRNRRHDDEEEEEEEDSDVGDNELGCGDDSDEEGEELGDEDSDEEQEMNFSTEEFPASKCKDRSFLEFSAIDIVPLMSTARESGSGSVHADFSADKENRSTPANRTFTGPVDRSAHNITAKQKGLYNQMVLEAQRSEGKGRLEPALQSYLSALEVCDSDPALHGKMAFLSREMNFL